MSQNICVAQQPTNAQLCWCYQAAQTHQSPPDANPESHWGKEMWLPTCEMLSNSSVGACDNCMAAVSVVKDASSSREITRVHLAHTVTCKLTSGAMGSWQRNRTSNHCSTNNMIKDNKCKTQGHLVAMTTSTRHYTVTVFWVAMTTAPDTTW